MLCKKCGETLQQGEKFCPNCGAKYEVDDSSNSTSGVNTASSGAYQTQGNPQREESASSSQEHRESDFNSAYRANQSKSTGGFLDVFHRFSEQLNNWMDPVIRTFVNMKNGNLAMWGIAVLFSAIGSQVSIPGSFFGKIILSMIAVSIVFVVEIILVQFVSRSVGFEYGFSKTTASERNLLILVAIAIMNLLSMIVLILRLDRLHLGLLGAILSGILSAFILESMFYQYFQGNQAFEFIKKYLIVQIILAIIRFILITVVVAALTAAILAPLFGLWHGLH